MPRPGVLDRERPDLPRDPALPRARGARPHALAGEVPGAERRNPSVHVRELRDHPRPLPGEVRLRDPEVPHPGSRLPDLRGESLLGEDEGEDGVCLAGLRVPGSGVGRGHLLDGPRRDLARGRGHVQVLDEVPEAALPCGVVVLPQVEQHDQRDVLRPRDRTDEDPEAVREVEPLDLRVVGRADLGEEEGRDEEREGQGDETEGRQRATDHARSPVGNGAHPTDGPINARGGPGPSSPPARPSR